VKEVLTYQASRAQRRLWFIEQLAPGEPVHNISFERRYAGQLDPAILRAAVADVIGRHESLRTRFVVRDKALWQVVLAPPEAPPVEFADLSDAPDPNAVYRDLCARTGARVFDLGQAPLLRMTHARLGPDKDGLIVVLHHMIADAISTDLFVRDLNAAYEARLAGRAPEWPELPVQYADFTAWQEERADDPSVRQGIDYWRGQLADLSTLDITEGRPWPRRQSQQGSQLDFTIADDVMSTLDEFVRAERATAFMGLLATYAATLGWVFGSEDVAVTSPVAGRPLPELRDVVGMFVDQVVLRLDLSGAPTFRELVRAARRVVSEAHDHDSVSFDQIVTALAPERVAGRTPLAQAAINLQPLTLARQPAGRMPRATAASQIDTGTVTHDLLLDLAPYPAPCTGTLRYRPDVVDAAAAHLVCTVFPRLLRAALAEPDRPMWTFEELGADRRPVRVDPGRHEARGKVRPAERCEPETPVEEALLDGWRWLLPKAEFGVTDDFFDIGGDSILAIHAVAEARRHGLELTVQQILDLRTIRALAAALATADRVDRPAPLGITGSVIVQLPAAAAEPPGLLVPQEIMAALAGPAHEAYATTTTDLVVAATLAATGAPAVAVADTRREPSSGTHAVPGVLRVEPVTGAAELLRAAKEASLVPEPDDPGVLGVRVLSLPDNVFMTDPGEAGERVVVTLAGARLLISGPAEPDLAERVRDHLVRLVEHCAAAEPVYSAADFPDAGLDDAALAGLLAGLDVEAGP
jgi:hypothetical protein